jgi:hypothetical protein
MNKIPAIIPTMCIDKVVELMNENGLQPRADIAQRTVKSFIDELMNFLGFKAWEVKNDVSVVEVCAEKIVDVIQQVISPSNPPSHTNYIATHQVIHYYMV